MYINKNNFNSLLNLYTWSPPQKIYKLIQQIQQIDNKKNL